MNKLLLSIALLVGGCATTSTKPVKELTLREKAIGTYEIREDENHFGRLALLENGIAERYVNGNKDEEEGKWKISKEGELHLTNPKGNRMVLRINKDSSITLIAGIRDGKRTDFPKEPQMTLQKIK